MAFDIIFLREMIEADSTAKIRKKGDLKNASISRVTMHFAEQLLYDYFPGKTVREIVTIFFYASNKNFRKDYVSKELIE